jgi:hypothetical protein
MAAPADGFENDGPSDQHGCLCRGWALRALELERKWGGGGRRCSGSTYVSHLGCRLQARAVRWEEERERETGVSFG